MTRSTGLLTALVLVLLSASAACKKKPPFPKADPGDDASALVYADGGLYPDYDEYGEYDDDEDDGEDGYETGEDAAP